jgi:hypothetical protein
MQDVREPVIDKVDYIACQRLAVRPQPERYDQCRTRVLGESFDSGEFCRNTTAILASGRFKLDMAGFRGALVEWDPSIRASHGELDNEVPTGDVTVALVANKPCLSAKRSKHVLADEAKFVRWKSLSHGGNCGGFTRRRVTSSQAEGRERPGRFLVHGGAESVAAQRPATLFPSMPDDSPFSLL